MIISVKIIFHIFYLNKQAAKNFTLFLYTENAWENPQFALLFFLLFKLSAVIYIENV